MTVKPKPIDSSPKFSPTFRLLVNSEAATAIGLRTFCRREQNPVFNIIYPLPYLPNDTDVMRCPYAHEISRHE